MKWFLLTVAILCAGCAGAGAQAPVPGDVYEIRFDGNPSVFKYGHRYNMGLYKIEGGQALRVMDCYFTASSGVLGVSSGPGNDEGFLLCVEEGGTTGTVRAALGQNPNGPHVGERNVTIVPGDTFRCDVTVTVNGQPADGANISFRFQQSGLPWQVLGPSGQASRNLPQTAIGLELRNYDTPNETYRRVVVNGVTYTVSQQIVPIQVQPAGGLLTVNVEYIP